MDNIADSADIVKMKYLMRGEVPVRLTLTSRHVLPDFAASGTAPSDFTLFDDSSEDFDEDSYDDDDISDSSLYGTDSGSSGTEEDVYTFCTTAGMKSECGVITVTYEESNGNPTEIIFDTGLENMVTIHRMSGKTSSGIVNTLVLERGRRHISTYRLPLSMFVPLETVTYAKKVDVNLTFENGGEINLDYLVELRGLDVQRTGMKIVIERM